MELPINLNIVFISSQPSTSTDLKKEWFSHLDNTVRHRVQREISKQFTKANLFRYNYSFHSYATSKTTATVLSNYISAIARPSNPDAYSDYYVDVDAVNIKLSELNKILATNQDLSLGYTLFLLDLDILQKSGYVYHRGWSELELISLSTNSNILSAVEATKIRNINNNNNMNVMDEEDAFETDVVPADVPFDEETDNEKTRPAIQIDKVSQQKRLKEWLDITVAQIDAISKLKDDTLTSSSSSSSSSSPHIKAALELLNEKSSPRQESFLFDLEQIVQQRDIKYATFQSRSHSLSNHHSTSNNINNNNNNKKKKKNSRCTTDAWLSQKERYGWLDIKVSSNNHETMYLKTIQRGNMGTFHDGTISRTLPDSLPSQLEDSKTDSTQEELNELEMEWYNIRRLTPIVSSFMRHVVTPPTQLVSVEEIQHAKKFRRTERISFHIHVVDVLNQWNDGTGEQTITKDKDKKKNKKKKNKNRNQKKSRTLQFDMKSFKRQITQLRAPDQEFSFTFQRMSLNDDAALASAYYTSMRYSVQPTLHLHSNKNQMNQKEENKDQSDFLNQYDQEDQPAWYEKVGMDAKRTVYLDSQHLHNQLKKIQQEDVLLQEKNVNSNIQDSQKEKKDEQRSGNENKLSSRDIPIFIFAHAMSDRSHVGTPVMMEDNQISTSIHNMVFAVEHGQGIHGSKILWKTNLFCSTLKNSKDSIYEDIGNPIRSTLRSVANALGGMQPLHQGPAVSDWHDSTLSSRKERENDWQWSVGSSPLSETNTNSNPSRNSFSIFNTDAYHRSQITQSIVASELLLTGSNQISAKVASLHSIDYQHMKTLQQVALDARRNITLNVQLLQFDFALRRTKIMLKASRDVSVLVEKLNEIDNAHKCIKHGQEIMSNPFLLDRTSFGSIASITGITDTFTLQTIGIVSGMIALILFLCVCWRKRIKKRVKPKIN